MSIQKNHNNVIPYSLSKFGKPLEFYSPATPTSPVTGDVNNLFIALSP